jgi:hypothetical protein
MNRLGNKHALLAATTVVLFCVRVSSARRRNKNRKSIDFLTNQVEKSDRMCILDAGSQECRLYLFSYDSSSKAVDCKTLVRLHQPLHTMIENGNTHSLLKALKEHDQGVPVCTFIGATAGVRDSVVSKKTKHAGNQAAYTLDC